MGKQKLCLTARTSQICEELCNGVTGGGNRLPFRKHGGHATVRDIGIEVPVAELYEDVSLGDEAAASGH